MRFAVRVVALACLALAPAGARGAPDELDQSLGSPITVSFSSTPLEDVLDALRESVRLNVVVDPAVQASELRVTGEASGEAAGKFLDRVLTQVKLKRTRWCGALLLHAPDAVPGPEPEAGKGVKELEQRVGVGFLRTPLSEALERIKTRHKVDVFLPSRVRSRMRQEADTVTLRLYSIELRHVLTHLCRGAGLTWSWTNGKVELGLAAGGERAVDSAQLRDVDLRQPQELKQEEDVEALVKQLAVPSSREGALKRLAAVGDRVVAPVVDLLPKADGPTAEAILRLLAKLGKGREPEILAVFKDTSRSLEVRTAAGLTLGQLKAEVAIPTLIEALDDKWFKISETARGALVQIGPPAVAPLRKRYAEERDKAKGAKEGLVYRALLVFGNIADPTAREVLIEALATQRRKDDRDVPLRHHAAIGLGFTGDPNMIEPLIAALEREKVFLVAKYIARSLNWLTDAELPPQAEVWKNWWRDNRARVLGKKGTAELDDMAQPLKPDFGGLPNIGEGEKKGQ